MTGIPFPPAFHIVTDDAVLEAYGHDAITTGKAAALARPRSIGEAAEILAWCDRHGVGITFCGSRTSLTGSSVAHGGLLMSTEHFPAQWRVYPDPDMPGRWLVDAGPAIILGDLQDQLAAQGYFYPPDPTSRRDVMLGATVATNASGEDSYKYGATRRWVRGLSYLRADGRQIHAKRAPHATGNGVKNACGYPFRDNDVDLLIGSEGTLGLITGLTLEVLPAVPRYFALLYFLPSEADALDQVAVLAGADRDLRCLEYMDAAAVAILAERGVHVPAGAGAALYIKQEYGEGGEDRAMAAWCDYLESCLSGLNCSSFMEHVHFAGDDHGREELRRWRHHIPATINERAARFRSVGGGKVGTDWYVPVARLKEMFAAIRRDQGDMTWVIFGHIGNGHPHVNMIAHDEAEYRRARQLLLEHSTRATAWGGGVSGEHGLGKLKTHLLAVQYGTEEIAAMRALKQRMDPNGTLCPGNIFPA